MPDEETTFQEVNGDVCTAKLPTPVQWDGAPVAAAAHDQTWVLWPPAAIGQAAKPSPNVWLAALVDVKEADIVSATYVTEKQLDRFVSHVARGRIAGPGNPPPPPCDTPLRCGRMMAAYGMIAANAPWQAHAKALSCEQ